MRVVSLCGGGGGLSLGNGCGGAAGGGVCGGLVQPLLKRILPSPQ